MWVIRLLGAALTAAAVLTLTACSGGESDAISLRGDLTTTGSTTAAESFTMPADGKSCKGYGGFSDIAAGAPVTVYDSTGKIIGTGPLDAGKWVGVTCSFTFTVNNVPASDFYQVEVSHRGKMTVSPADAKAGNVHMSLTAP